MEGEGEPVLQTADIVSAVLTRWSAAQRGGDKAGQVAVVLELVELSQDDGMLDAMCQESVVDVFAAMMADPPLAPNPDSTSGHQAPPPTPLQLRAAAASGLCSLLAFICSDLAAAPPQGVWGEGQAPPPPACHHALCAHLPRLARSLYSGLWPLLAQRTGEGAKTACWLLHFLAVCSPPGGLKWSAEQRRSAAQSLLGCLGRGQGADPEVMVAALHALSMSMHRDASLKTEVAQAAGVPLILRLLQHSDLQVVTAAAGALHAVVQGSRAYVPWVVQLDGLAQLLALTRRLPASTITRDGLLQALWALGECACADLATAQQLLDGGALPALVDLVYAAHGVQGGLQAAAALLLGALVGGRDQKEERSRIRDKVISELGVGLLEHWAQAGGPVLRLVAASIRQQATALQVERSKALPPHRILELPVQPAGPSPDPALDPVDLTATVPKLPETCPRSPPPAAPAGPDPRLVQSSFPAKEALVIGQGNYTALAKVKHAVRDAQALADLVTKGGCRVLTCLDAKSEAMRASCALFEQRCSAGALAVIIFLGHGALCQGRHFLLPVDFQPPTPAAAATIAGTEPAQSVTAPAAESEGLGIAAERSGSGQLMEAAKAQATDLDQVLDKLGSKGVRHVLLLLDPCREFKASTPEDQEEAIKLHGPGSTQPPKTSSSSSSSSSSINKVLSKAPPPSETSRSPPPPGHSSKDQLASVIAKAAGLSAPAAPASAAPVPRKPGGVAASAQPRQKALPGAAAKKAVAGHGGAKAEAEGGGPGTDRVKLTESLVWSHQGLRASLVAWAAGPGGVALGPGKGSTSSPHSLWVEALLRSLSRRLTLRAALEAAAQAVRTASAGLQSPGWSDDGLFGPGFKLL